MSDDQPRALIEQAAEYLAELVRPQDPPVPMAQFWARGVELEAKLRAYLMTEQP